MTSADLVLPDSGFMVLLWRLLRGRRIQRVSGLAYLKDLLGRAAFRQDRSLLWVVPHETARDEALRWLQRRAFLATESDCYIAPIYGTRVEDPILLARLEECRPSQVIIALSGGVQEKLGLYLRENYKHRLAIHCIGGALGFVAGYQVAIPEWADRFYLGWLFRLFSNPRQFLPRAASALPLPWLILRYGERLPV